VHGAKGLEAPVVFLFDANLPDAPLRDRLLWSDGLPFYKTAEFRSAGGFFSGIYDEQKAASLGEFYRLLYVAMTRARDRLYVCGWETKGGEREQSWYGCIREALEKLPGARRIRDDLLAMKGPEFFDPEVLALGSEDAPSAKTPREETKASPVPGFFYEKVSSARPSFTDYTAASPLENPDGENEAASRGSALHRLLEKLADVSPDEYVRAARDYPAELVETAAAILQNPEFDFIFKNRSRSEVELAYVEDGEAKVARIDRLVFASDAIWIIDYKSAAKVPAAAPEHYVRQLALYRSLVEKIYPGAKIRTAILWTSAPKLMEVL
jgi:ATP-dependent helicase/nuclease subunit A